MLFCLCAQRPDSDGENRHTACLLFRKGILTACHVAHERGERIELFRTLNELCRAAADDGGIVVAVAAGVVGGLQLELVTFPGAVAVEGKNAVRKAVAEIERDDVGESLFIKHGKANNFTFIDNGEDLPAVGDLAVVSAHGTASLYQAVRPLI